MKHGWKPFESDASVRQAMNERARRVRLQEIGESYGRDADWAARQSWLDIGTDYEI